ncbi:MAG: phosphate signaling complex protein PhoU [Candidatus Cloacimonadaceae bacterium]|nr:phosphate signaling complex protein PhoU [Candidatus Cloacimonadaceae bacterium]
MLIEKISELKKLLMAEAGLVENMVAMCFTGIKSVSGGSLEDVMVFETRVNQLEIEIENLCTRLIALYQPEAKDLRVILMIYKINNDLERLGDQAVNIAESSSILSGNPILNLIPELMEMKVKALAMLKQSITAFTNEDVELSRQICHDDSIVDDLNRGITAHLIELMKQSPQIIEDFLHVLRIAKNLERIADLSTNIAENTVYLAQGKVIKHHADAD